MGATPRVLYEVDDLRVVLRNTDSYPKGYVEIERRGRDAVGATIWQYCDSMSLETEKQTGHVAVVLFLHLMRARCPELK